MATPAKIEKFGLKDAAKDMADKSRERVNSGPVNFDKDHDRNIDALAEASFKTDAEKAAEYKTRIINSLQAHLKDGVTVEQLWAWLAQEEQNCTTTEIIEGVLTFFNEKFIKKDQDDPGHIQKVAINIDQFLIDPKLPTKSFVEIARDQKREQEIYNTRTALQSLLVEIQANNPSLTQRLI